jgi:isoleucyl-tRNA synthetase
VFHELSEYCANELSAFYIDILKDRLYVEKADGFKRRSAQTVLWHILDVLTRLIAPIMSFTAEQVSDFYQKDKKQSIHLQHFAPLCDRKIVAEEVLERPVAHFIQPSEYSNKIVRQLQDLTHHAQRMEEWKIAREIRSALLKALEVEREKGIIKHSLDARISIYCDPSMKYYAEFKEFFMRIASSQTAESFMKEFMIVSEVEFLKQQDLSLVQSIYPGLWVKVEHARGVKCPRCWQWDITKQVDDLCKRCEEIIE